MKNIYWAAINSVPGIGSKTLRQTFMDIFMTAKNMDSDKRNVRTK